MQDTAFLLFVVGFLPAGGLAWLWRRTGTPGDVMGMALAALAYVVGLGAMFGVAWSLGTWPTAQTCVWLAFPVLFGLWRELVRNPDRVGPLAADAAAEDEEVDRLRGEGTSLG